MGLSIEIRRNVGTFPDTEFACNSTNISQCVRRFRVSKCIHKEDIADSAYRGYLADVETYWSRFTSFRGGGGFTDLSEAMLGLVLNLPKTAIDIAVVASD
jgi:hypothetical protein